MTLESATLPSITINLLRRLLQSNAFSLSPPRPVLKALRFLLGGNFSFSSSSAVAMYEPNSSTERKPNRRNSKLTQVSHLKAAAGQDSHLKRKRPWDQRSDLTNSNRRHRISEGLKALQGLLPHSTSGFQASILDGVIEYAEYLQLQMKELSQRRLRSQPEAATNPLCYLEGYNHHIHGGIPDAPLQEFMSDTFEVNPFTEINLLQSRGLFLVPMNIAEKL